MNLGAPTAPNGSSLAQEHRPTPHSDFVPEQNLFHGKDKPVGNRSADLPAIRAALQPDSGQAGRGSFCPTARRAARLSWTDRVGLCPARNHEQARRADPDTVL